MGIGSGTGFNRMFEGSQGMQANRMLDALGLPDKVGDIIGASIDAQHGDMAGMMRNLTDLYSGVGTRTMDSLFGKGLPPSNFMPRPSLSPFPGFTETPMGFRPTGLSREAPFGTGFLGRSMERAINTNPMFKSAMEGILGGTIIPDGRRDGRLTVYRPPFNDIGSLMRNAFGGGLPQQGLAGLLGGLNLPLAGPLMANGLTRSVLGGLQRMEANIGSFMRGLPAFPPPNPFEGTLIGRLGDALAGNPGIFGRPMGGLIGMLQNSPTPFNPLVDTMSQSFGILGTMMQASAALDRQAFSFMRV